MPITWKNINSPNFSSSNALMESATDTFTGGLDALSKAAQGYSDDQKQLRMDVRDDNTQNLLNQIQQMKDLGTYNAQADQFSQDALAGQNIDASKVLSAYGNRRQGIQDEIMANDAFATNQYNYSQKLLDQAEKPIIDQFKSLVANNEFDAAKQFQKENEGKVRDWSGLLDYLEQGDIAAQNQYATEQQRIREQTRFNQEQANIVKDKKTADIINDAVQTSADPVTARAKVASSLREQGISGNRLSEAVAGIDQKWQDYHDMSDSQKAQVSAATDVADQQFNLDVEKLDGALERSLAAVPVDNRFNFSSGDRVSQAAGVEAVVNLAPKDTTINTSGGAGGTGLSGMIVKDVIPKLRKELGLGANEEVPGVILQLAAQEMTTENEWLGGDEKLDVNEFARRAKFYASAYRNSLLNYGKQEEIIKAYETDKQTLFDMRNEEVSQLLNQIKETNKNITLLKKGNTK